MNDPRMKPVLGDVLRRKTAPHRHDCDYAALERERDKAMAAYADMVREIEASQAELIRLRAIEVAATKFLAYRHAVTNPEISAQFQAVDALAEACGRKG